MSDVAADPPSKPWLAWLPVLIGVGVAFIASLTWLQWWRPYIEHDDWDMLLPNGPTFVENHSLRLLHEGRWLNNWWWMLGSQDIGPRGAAILFAIALLIVVAVMVRSFSIGWWSVPAVTALYGAPMMSMLSYWPATLAAPMWMLALTICLLWVTRERWVLHLVILAVGTIVISLGYPPLALVLLAFLVGLHHRRNARQLLVLAGTLALAYIAGILLVFTLNDLRFGVFGLKIQSWRNPSPLTSLTSLSHHLHTVERNWAGVIRPATLPLVAAAAALIGALAEPRLRRRLSVLAIALLGGALLSASSTILNGVDVPSRAMAWVWPVLVLVAVWGLEALRTNVRIVGAAALTFIAVWSGLYSAYATVGHRSDQNGLNAMRAAVVAQYRNNPGAHIIFAIPHSRPTAAERQAVWEVANAMAKIDGIRTVSACTGCRLVPSPINPSRPAAWIFSTQGAVVVQLPNSLSRSGLHAEPEPSWLVPLR
jgi:hypothetical protein